MRQPERSSPVWIKIRRVEDLCRLAASVMTMGQPIYLVRFKKEDTYVLGLLAVYRDFYRYYGVPLFYYTSCEGVCTNKKYVSFKVDESGERVEFTDRAIPGTMMIPIIEFESLPPILIEGLQG